MDTILHNIIAYLDLYLKQDICDIVEEWNQNILLLHLKDDM
jgi:hypothetical protein